MLRYFDYMESLIGFPEALIAPLYNEGQKRFLFNTALPLGAEAWLGDNAELIYEDLQAVWFDEDNEIEHSPRLAMYKVTSSGVTLINGYWASMSGGGRDTEEFTILFGPVAEEVEKVITDILAYIKEAEDERAAEDGSNDNWNATILEKKLKTTIEKDITSFLTSKDFYINDLGIGWKTGLILYGPPGNGKTRLIRALGQKFNLVVKKIEEYIQNGKLNLPSAEGLVAEDIPFYQDFGTHRQWASIYKIRYPDAAKPTIIVAEDIDKTIFNKYSADAPLIRLSDFLNAVDGVRSSSGIILIATTNFPKDLPESLLSRPGRFDHIYKVENPTEALFKQYFKSRNIEIKGVNLAKKFHDMGVSMAFAEQFVLWSKVATKENKINKTTALEMIKRIEHHREVANTFCEDVTSDKTILGFD